MRKFSYAGPIVTIKWSRRSSITLAGDQLILMKRRVQRLSAEGEWSSVPPRNFGYARQNRHNMSPPELAVWHRLRGRQLGVKFRKQHPIGPYIADFYSRDCGLVVEVDGMQHGETAGSVAYDRRRDAYMRAMGLVVLRFDAHIVGRYFEATIEEIARYARQRIEGDALGFQWLDAEHLRVGDAADDSVAVQQIVNDVGTGTLYGVELEDAETLHAHGGKLRLEC